MTTLAELTAPERHAVAVERVTSALRDRAHHVEAVFPVQPEGDLFVDHLLWLMVRTARWRDITRTVRTKDRVYTYAYRRLIFNLHRHGHPPDPPPALWALCDETGDIFVIPHVHTHGALTIDVVTRPDLWNFGRLERWRERWDLVRDAVPHERRVCA